MNDNNSPQWNQPPVKVPIIIPQRGVPDSPTGVNQKRFLYRQPITSNLIPTSINLIQSIIPFSQLFPRNKFIFKPYFTLSNVQVSAANTDLFPLSATIALQRKSDNVIVWSESPYFNTQPSFTFQVKFVIPNMESDIFVDFDPTLEYLQNLQLLYSLNFQNAGSTEPTISVDFIMSYEVDML